MLIQEAANVALTPVRADIGIRWLITEKEGAPNFAMRLIELQPGAVFAPHQHPYEHEIYVLEGEGIAMSPAGDVGALTPGKFMYIAPDEMHGYRTVGDKPLRFICVIPLQK